LGRARQRSRRLPGAEALAPPAPGAGLRTRILELARGGLAAIEAARRRVDDLNVYPVPDGDTGTNLALTVRAVVDALEAPGADDREGLAHEVSRAALMGARGNSGVILSQIVRGAAESLRESDDLARALRSASDAAYRAVRTPVEGTMLTAIRELAEEAERGSALAEVVARGDDCVARTQEMLPVLTEAGVVDAGAAGLVEIVRGIGAALTGEPLPERLPDEAWRLDEDAIHRELSRYRYCTVFVVEGDGLDAGALEAELDPLGDSLFVVGDATALKVHVHTDDPGRALSLGILRGTVAGVEIANMHEQMRVREERLLHPVPSAPQATAAIAVAAGDGNRRLFESLGARFVDGGRTMNPSTADLLAAVEADLAPEAVILPNNKNVQLAAEHAAEHATKRVRVVPTASLQAGLAAMVAFDPTASAEENAEAMLGAAAEVATGAVTIASRDVDTNGLAVRKGAWLGLAEGVPVAGGSSFEDVSRTVLERLLAEPRSVLTLLTGEEPPPLDLLLAELETRYPELELEVHQGGQPHYALLIAAE
jgi:DAK2 domain fusion protein YloV